jgi:predicted helicase
MVDWGREKYMHHLLQGKNISLVVTRQSTDSVWNNVQITSNMIDNRYHFSYKGTASQFPLYLYAETNGQHSLDDSPERIPNLNMEIVEQIAVKINHAFLPDENIVCDLVAGFDGTFSPLDILDYIYAVLHSPTYREKYKEFLKIDFPRVPYPIDAKTFWKLVEHGGELRELHLLESPKVECYITKYPEDGTNIVDKPRFEVYDYSNELPGENGKDNYPDYLGAVYINDTQYFADVPTSAWEFYIGGYQPAQKWLKDRKGRELSYDDILHYQKIIVALSETDRIMKEIDKIEI